jgi:hypothetical protein
MNEDNDNAQPNDDEEKFSDDPEEQLRIENDLLRLKLQAETGADLHQLEDVPPEVEHAFLNNILAFERQLDSVEEVSIFEILGEPTDFRNESELDDDEVDAELDRLIELMSENRIEVDYGMEYPARLKYKFITEELFLHETQRFDIPDMVNHYIYEEFHPNHKLTIEGLAEEFLEMWLAKSMDEDSFIFGKEFVSQEHGVYSKSQFFGIIRNIFDAYLSFDHGDYEIENISFDEINDGTGVKGLGFAEGTIRYEATLESKEVQIINGPFKIYMAQTDMDWEIMSMVMPGLEL